MWWLNFTVVGLILEDVSINNEYELRERLQAVLVLEVVFSAFYVSDDTEFEFIENKIMGFRMTGRQIWVEVGVISWACEACGETWNFPG